MYPKHTLRLSASSRQLFRSASSPQPRTSPLHPITTPPQPSPQPRAYSTTPYYPPSNRLKGRSCMITGGTSGIGYAIAARFLQEGIDQVILVGRSPARLVSAATTLSSSSSTAEPTSQPQSSSSPETPQQHTLLPFSPTISLLVGDIADAASWSRELEKVMQTTNPTHLINAAGLSISRVLPKSSPEDIARILDTNLQGAILTTRAFLRAAMRNHVRAKRSPSAAASASTVIGNGDGDGESTGADQPPPSKSIINIASLLARKGGTGAVTYAASKAGILGLTRSVAVEAGTALREVRVRSNAIVPGYVETPMIEDFSEGETTRLKQSIPLGRFGLPHEVADAAVFLALNEYANNCVLNLDGGLSAV
ncbi:SDR family NAD(P)-dependent oxidoreductase [Aspergillus fijiensis CBS 313.89]|uniref:NAD(P)-binding protein n=1 Tax=Aspergillus fijiensis CBS 313.89 TaxID=1448319 RepID=A0A8G1RQA4_9EURO|nr:NAD(P)-binding protein [Aspergillus fijiensis CBS 313.89]RAK76813.1 NAD(P)-binding protein [Aspergillus fijiensis CBS 313.89]